MNFEVELNKKVASTIKAVESLEKKGMEIFSHSLNCQQKLTVCRLKERNFFINYSETGAGKTKAAIAVAKYLNLKHIIVFCPNNVKTTWYNQINEANFVNHNFIKIDGVVSNYSKKDFTFEIFNYDKFNSEDRADKRIQALANSKKYELIVFDEIHHLKNKECETYKNILKFVTLVKKKNPNVKILGATATPITTSTKDFQGIYEILSGKKADELDAGSLANKIINTNMLLESTGFGYFPKSKMKIRYNKIDSEKLFNEVNGKSIFKTELANIDGSIIEKECIESKGNFSKIEELHLKLKFDAYKNLIRKGTVIYTEYTYGDKILFELKKLVEKIGFSACIYSGSYKESETEDYKDSIEEFINKEKDVLIATRSMYEGTDGIQYVSNRLILHTIPSVWAYFHQLIGRFDRQGSNFEKEGVDIFVPMVVFKLPNGKITSFDKRKWQSAMIRKAQDEGAIRGNIDIKLPNMKDMVDDVVSKLKGKYELTEISREII